MSGSATGGELIMWIFGRRINLFIHKEKLGRMGRIPIKDSMGDK